jgi:hypothetical protein
MPDGTSVSFEAPVVVCKKETAREWFIRRHNGKTPEELTKTPKVASGGFAL